MPEIYTHDTNPLGIKPPGKLMLTLAVPSIIANVVNALYNIVDQIFIGHKIGYLGNAATNIAFPLTTICLAVGLMIGLGGAAGFNLSLGKDEPSEARKYGGTVASSLIICGVIICILSIIFLRPLMILFGATDQTIQFSMDYAGIIAIGLPFLIFSIGFSPLVRGDGSPLHSMLSMVVGALVNVFLDYLFVFVFEWGIKGAAWATVIGEFISFVILLFYFKRFKSVRFTAGDFIPRFKLFIRTCQLGFTSLVFQGSMLFVIILVNNLLRSHGAQSVYGADIPIAVIGIVNKINSIFIGVLVGLNQGSQPIYSFNYGAKRYSRVRQTLRIQITYATIASIVMFLLFQLIPGQLIALFGEASDLYFEFAVKYTRGFSLVLFLTGYQMAASTFFPTIGKAAKGAILALCKQLIILVPLILIMAHLFGLDGIIYATPISDGLSTLLATVFFVNEIRQMPKVDEAL